MIDTLLLVDKDEWIYNCKVKICCPLPHPELERGWFGFSSELFNDSENAYTVDEQGRLHLQDDARILAFTGFLMMESYGLPVYQFVFDAGKVVGISVLSGALELIALKRRYHEYIEAGQFEGMKWDSSLRIAVPTQETIQ